MIFPVADAHCDFLYGMAYGGFDMNRCAQRQTTCLEHLEKGNVKLQFFAVWVDSKKHVPYARQCVEMIDAYYRMLDETPAIIPLTRDFDENGGRIASVLTIEGGEAIEGSLANLRIFHRLGVRAMTLTWNETNALAQPAMRKRAKGLTEFGRDVIREMDRLNMAIDLSHLSDAGIDDILEMTDSAVFASHSNARGAFKHPRSLKDVHIKEIARRGGVVGVNFYQPQLTDNAHAIIDDIADQIEYIADLGGIDCVAIGSDFDGMVRYPIGLENPSKMQGLLGELSLRGFAAEDILKIAYGNLSRYIKAFI